MPETDLHITAEIKLYYDLHVPENLAAPAPLLIAIHGYGAHKRYMMRQAQMIAPDGFVIASLQAPHQHFSKLAEGYRIGFGWLTDHKPEEYIALHHYFVNEVIERLSTKKLIDRSRIFIFGFSQAVALNFRFAFTHPEVLRGVIAVCGGIPGDLETNPSYKPFSAETFYLYGDDDEFYTEEKFKAFDRKLADKLPNYRSKQYRGKHEITDEMRSDIKNFLEKFRAGDSSY
jgi:phospholipase/carboxylesterase